MTSYKEKAALVIQSFEEDNQTNNSMEVIRKCTTQSITDTSWDQSQYVSAYNSRGFKQSEQDPTPPFMSIMIDASPTDSRTNSSTQTELVASNPDLTDLNLSFNKDFHLEDSSSNDNDTERSTASKRCRHNSFGDDKEMRPWKKTKCTNSSTSSNTDASDSKTYASVSSSRACSESEVSFKSINSNYSYKTRKRRRKSDSNLIRDVLQRSRRFSGLSKSNHSESNTPGTPRNEKPCRRSNRTKKWRIMDLCTWIGKKGYQSITGLYSDTLREPIGNKENKDNVLVQEVKQLKKFVEEVDQKYTRMARENEVFKEEMKKMNSKILALESKLSCQQMTPMPQCVPPLPPLPPPPPPPPPPPLPPAIPPLPASKLPVRSHTIPRCGSAPPRITGPRLTITPQDIANVKLRKAKDNPVRPKPTSKDIQQPLVTQHMLEATRAKLGRNRPVAASTPKQQLTELEKCLLQESSVTSLYRRRITRSTFRSAEELRVRPYPASRCTRSPLSPRSPRSNSLSRAPASSLKFPLFCPSTPNKE